MCIMCDLPGMPGDNSEILASMLQSFIQMEEKAGLMTMCTR